MGSHTKFSEIRSNHENVYPCYRQHVKVRSLVNKIIHKMGHIYITCLQYMVTPITRKFFTKNTKSNLSCILFRVVAKLNGRERGLQFIYLGWCFTTQTTFIQSCRDALLGLTNV